MDKPTNPNRPTNHARPASSRRPDQEQLSLRWVSNPELLWWCTLSKHILIQMTTPWSAQARDTTLDTRVTHCIFGLIKVETEVQTYGLELHAVGSNRLEESSPRNDDSDMVEPMAPPSSDMFKARGSGKSRSGIEAFHTRTQVEALAHPFQLLLQVFHQASSKTAPEIVENLDRSANQRFRQFNVQRLHERDEETRSLNASLIRAHLLRAFLGGAAARSEDPSRAHIP